MYKSSMISLKTIQSKKFLLRIYRPSWESNDNCHNQIIKILERLFDDESLAFTQVGGLSKVSYNNLRTTCKNQVKMNTYSTENCFNPYSLYFPHFAAFFCSTQAPLTSHNRFKNLNTSERTPLYQYKLLDEVESPSFQTRFQPSIIIRCNTELSQPQRIQSPNPKPAKKVKPIQKKIAQKQSRNVASNLLRIFLKHIVQLKFYDSSINKMIKSRALNCTLAEFHSWLDSFKINYKNYIRFTQIKRVLNDDKHQDMSSIFRMLLRQYTKGVGVEHCLTSRRIEKSAISMHLLGLKELLQQATHE